MRFRWRKRWSKSVAAGVTPQTREISVSDQRSEISFDPFSYQRRTTNERWSAKACKSGGEELVRVVIRKEQHEKIAHKIDQDGRLQAGDRF